MPFHFDITNNISDYSSFKSVLIVPCRFCPAASLSVTSKEPYINFFRNFLATESYLRHIKKLKSSLEEKGIKADVFESKIIHQFVLCMWTARRRRKLGQIANNYDAIIVLGCEGAVKTIQDSMNPSDTRVIQGLETKGLMSIQPRFHFTGKISLDLESLTPISMQEEKSNLIEI